MISRRQFLIRTAHLSLAAPLLAACATQAPAAPAATTSEPVAATPAAASPTAQADAQTPAPAEATAAPAAAPAQAGGTLTIGVVEEPETLNPLITQLVTSFNILAGVIDGLLTFDTAQTLQPALAESYEVAADGLTYTFKLRQNVKWHDGPAFTSADVKATHDIIMNAEFGAYSQLGWENITDLQTPDEHTVIMKLEKPYAPFLSYVGFGSIVPKHWIDKGVDVFKNEYGRKPIGTGPFKVTKWESAQFVELDKNPDYWGTAQGRAPKLDKIVIKIVPDTNTLQIQLKTGEVQLTDAVPPRDLDAVKALPDVTVTLTDGTEWTHIDLKYIDFLMDKRVRQALDFATPKAEIVDKLLKGLATVAFGDQAPGTPYYNPNIQARPYDLDQAAKLLADAGFTKNAQGVLEKDGKPLEIEYWVPSGDDMVKQIQQVIAASWRKLGITVDAREEDINSIWGPNGYQFTQKMTAGQYSWTNGNDPDNVFYWNSSQIPKDPEGTGGNVIGYFNQFDFQKQIDDLTTAGAEAVDPEKRKQIYWQIQDLLNEEVPVIFLYWGKRIYTAPKNLTGFKPNTYNYLLWDAADWGFAQ